jgi:hypothetical protein
MPAFTHALGPHDLSFLVQITKKVGFKLPTKFARDVRVPTLLLLLSYHTFFMRAKNYVLLAEYIRCNSFKRGKMPKIKNSGSATS